MPTHDEVDLIAEQWQDASPELPIDAMALFGRLFRVSRMVGDAMEATYRTFGISRPQFDVLATLRRSGQPHLTPGALASSMMFTTGGMTGLLDKLERGGMVARSPDPADRRGLRISLTSTGRELIDQAAVAGVAVQEHFLRGLNKRQREHFSDMLAHVMAQSVPEATVERNKRGAR